MKTLKVTPNAGINRRFPEHKLVGDKKQYVQKLHNFINLDGKTYLVGGASRYDTSAKPGPVTWAKRIYYEDGGDQKKVLFVIIGGKMYMGDDSTETLTQVTINGSYDITFETGYQIDATLKVSGTVSTFIVDGKYFYKFNGNAAGAWERLEVKTDIDGLTVEPTYIVEYLDCLWVLCKNRNVLLASENLNPESLNHPTRSALIDLPPGNGGFPKALAVHPNGYLYVIHENYFGPLSGSSPATFGVQPGDITHGFGTRAPRSVTILKDTVGFLNSKDNEYRLMSELSDPPLSYDIKLGELINPVKAHETVCHVDSNMNALRIAYYPSGGTTLGDEEIYSLDEEKWCGQTRGRKISCYCQWNGSGDDGRLLTGRSDIGAVMVNDESFNFDDTAIPFWYETASYVADDEITDVQFAEIYIDGKPTGDHALPMTYYLDSRITTNGVAYPNMQGEGIGNLPITIADQKSFVNRELFLIDKCKGRMIRFEMKGDASNREIEFYGIYATYNEENSKQTKYLVGR